MNKPPSFGTITPDDFRRIREVFESALERSPAERVPFVEQACSGNALLIDEVGRMLAADAERNPLLDGNALAEPVSRGRHFRWPFPNDFSPGPRRHG